MGYKCRVISAPDSLDSLFQVTNLDPDAQSEQKAMMLGDMVHSRLLLIGSFELLNRPTSQGGYTARIGFSIRHGLQDRARLSP